MTTFCVMCRGEIPEERARRGGHFCEKPECPKLYRKQRRAEIAKRKCRLCGRPGDPQEWAQFRRWRKAQQSLTTAVRSEHKATHEQLGVS